MKGYESVNEKTIAVIGLGYVGLPLAVQFGKKFETIGFDLSKEKIEHYKNNNDPTGEVPREEFEKAGHLTVTSDPADISRADYA